MYENNWNACLLYRNKQLTKQLKEYQEVSSLTGGSSSQMVAMGQLIRLRQNPSYGIIKDELEWKNLFGVIDLFYRVRIAWTSIYNNVDTGKALWERNGYIREKVN